MKKKYLSPQFCFDALKRLTIMEENEEVNALGISGDLELDMGE